MTDENDGTNEKDSDGQNAIAEHSAFGIKSRHPMEFLLKRGVGSLCPKVGDMVEGVILEKKGTRLFADLGAQGTGIVYGKEYYLARDIIHDLETGDTISAKVVDPDNEDGYVELSLKDAGEERRWIELKEMAEKGTVLELPVMEANRGGLIFELKGVKGFLPASQLSASHYPRVEGGDKEKIFQELQKLVGETLKVKVLDEDPSEQKLIFTEKELDQEILRETLSKYKVGDEVEGEITSVVDFGAFMKFDDAGLEGLIHISEMDWLLVEDPREILKAGDRVKAKIISIQRDKISLSLKALKEDPWKKVSEKYAKGDAVMGRVVKFNPFGAFVEFDQHVKGLVHISEFGTEARMKEKLELGQEYKFTVLLIDPAEHRMSLGIPGEKPITSPTDSISQTPEKQTNDV